MPTDLFEQSVRPEGDRAGVFEYDGETGYFYLCDLTKKDGETVVGAIHIMSVTPDFLKSDIEVAWNKSRDVVGLKIRGQLWAAFGAAGERFGGDYKPGAKALIPSDIASSF